MKIFFKIALLLVGLVLAGCATSDPNREVSSAKKPVGGHSQPVMVVAPVQPVQEVLACLQDKGSFFKKRIALGPWVDNTNKSNYVANGATGGFLPGPGTTAFAVDPLMSLGARVQDLTDLGMENNFRALLPNQVQEYAAREAAKVVADFFVDGKWLTLDISAKADVDAQADGVGPFYSNTGATVVAQVNLKVPGTSEILASSTLRRTVYSSKLGITFGRYIGSVLATGEASISNQQRLQLESAEYLVMLGLVDAMTKRPEGAACRSKVMLILGPPVSEARPLLVASAK